MREGRTATAGRGRSGRGEVCSRGMRLGVTPRNWEAHQMWLAESAASATPATFGPFHWFSVGRPVANVVDKWAENGDTRGRISKEKRLVDTCGGQTNNTT